MINHRKMTAISCRTEKSDWITRNDFAPYCLPKRKHFRVL
jgi:hypothetical protein